MAISSNLGYPRIGRNREMKKALEDFWSGKAEEQHLLITAKKIRQENWILQKEIGIQQIPSNDFSLYDHMLDMAILLGAIPERFQKDAGSSELERYFAMARGAATGPWKDVPPLEMTKWFNTNYHYLVPEITSKTVFRKNTQKIIGEYKDALEIGIRTRPVIIGPVSFLLLSKSDDGQCDTLSKISGLLPIYASILEELTENGVEWVQWDEPCLATDLDKYAKLVYQQVFNAIGNLSKKPKIFLASYFGSYEENIPLIRETRFDAIHLDLSKSEKDLDAALGNVQNDQMISLGLIDGRNIWKTDFQRAITVIEKMTNEISPDRLIISTSCSLMHVPQDAEQETHLPADARGLIAFSKQKLEEVVQFTELINHQKDESGKIRKSSVLEIHFQRNKFKHDNIVHERLGQITSSMLFRKNGFHVRKEKQRKRFPLPLLPITTIGSFPQTPDVRKKRSELGKQEITIEEYEKFIQEEILQTIKFQEDIGMDVLVHGEFERNDMVQYFAEQMNGFAFTEHGWVQSFGSRYVRPPIIYGDVSRPKPMTVKWITFAQSLTKKPVKGMLTGPITILNWSYVRNDQPQEETCKQIALAIRDEVVELESAGIGIIQIDEPALREGMPMHRANWDEYLHWAVECFRICTGGVKDETQIHTHMCYSAFNDIITSIAALDADVISIEAARSRMELLKAFSTYHYPNDIGPGVYDIHSPRIPTEKEIYYLLKEALKVLPEDQLWVNPDCGLKTRKWEEVDPALKAIVAATRRLRKEMDKFR